MKNLFVYSLVFLILLTGCSNRDKYTKTNEKEEQKKSDSTAIIKTFPKLDQMSNSKSIKQTCDSIVLIIDNILPKLKKVEKKTTLYNTPNTPVKIWYSDSDLPVKIEHAVTNDSGKFAGKFQYYFINGQIWYSNQIYARYIFDDMQLILWLDENWRINKIPDNNFKDREITLKTNIEKFLNDNK